MYVLSKLHKAFFHVNLNVRVNGDTLIVSFVNNMVLAIRIVNHTIVKPRIIYNASIHQKHGYNTQAVMKL